MTFFSFKIQIAFIEEIEVVVKEFFVPEHEQGNKYVQSSLQH